jgi:hypothetical protein
MPAADAATCKRADDIVRLDAFDHQERPAVRPDEVVQRLDLAREILRHRGALRLVLRIPVVAERLAQASKTTAK